MRRIMPFVKACLARNESSTRASTSTIALPMHRTSNRVSATPALGQQVCVVRAMSAPKRTGEFRDGHRPPSRCVLCTEYSVLSTCHQAFTPLPALHLGGLHSH